MNKIIFLALLTFVGCSTRITTRMTSMVSPEAQGKTLAGIVTGNHEARSSYKMDFSGHRNNNPLIQAKPSYRMGASSEVGLLRRLDVFLNLSNDPALGVKWQFLGTPKHEAKRGTFSASLVSSYSGYTQNDKRSRFFDDTDYNVKKINFQKDSQVYGLLLGYRVWDQGLIYIGNHKIFETVKGEVTTTNKELNDKKFGYGNSGSLHTLGMIFHPAPRHFVLKLELAHLITKWTRTATRTDNAANISAGFSW